MDQFNQIFQLEQEYRIIIYRRCAFAVVPQQARRHLNDHHHALSTTTRDAINQYIEALDGITRRKEDVIYLEPNTIAITGLPLFENGFRCTWEDDNDRQCPYICQTKRAIQQHCRDEHQWVNR